MSSITIRGLSAAAMACVALALPPLAVRVTAQTVYTGNGVSAAVTSAVTLRPRGAWSASVTYLTNDLVTSRGSTWRAKRSSKGKVPGSTSPSTAADWELFAEGLNPQGNWISTATYNPNDLVIFSGATWRAKITSSNKRPDTHPAVWETLAAKGATGEKGATGATGPRGPAGPNTLSNGSVTTPAIKFSSSTDSGIFSPGDGKIALVENGQLFLHDKGDNNAALGVGALGLNTTGAQNTALGGAALGSNTTGNYNTALGLSALGGNDTGASNTAIGRLALNQNQSGGSNTAVGDSALLKNNSSSSTAVGFEALRNNTSGTYNTALGAITLHSNTTGGSNTSVGFQALYHNTTGTNNTAVGADTLTSNTTGIGNIAIGSSALNFNTGGYYNIAIGTATLQGNTTASDNIAIGKFALDSLTAGGANIGIGTSAGYYATNSSNSIFIGNTGLDTDSATIRIGTESTQQSTFIAGINGINVSGAAVMVDSNGQLGVTSSSRRYKEDIASMPDMSAMLTKLRPVTFHYKKAYDDGTHQLQYGLIAEEVADVMPYLTVFNKAGQPETVKYHLLPSFLLEGFQEQQRTIATQAHKIDAQAGELASLRGEVERMKALMARLDRRLAAAEPGARDN